MKKATRPKKPNVIETILEEITEDLFLDFDQQKQINNLFQVTRRLIEMSATEKEAIAALKTQADETDSVVVSLKTAVDALVLKAGDDPAKIADLDAVSAQLAKQQADTQAVIDSANAALNPTTP